MSEPKANVMEQLVALCKRRGFIYPASEIYGGINGFWDYGPLGTLLKNNIRDWWWRQMVITPPIGPDGHPVDIVGLDSAIIQNPKTWVASGHVGGFSDPMTMCKQCKKLFRADHVWFVFFFNPEQIGKYGETLGEEGKVDVRKLLSEVFAREQLDPAVRRRLTNEDENLARAEAETASRPFLLMKGVVASSGDEARSTAELTAKQRREVQKHGAQPMKAMSLMAPDPAWPDDTRCPNCEAINSLTEPRQFNLMFESYAGAVRDEASKVYLRPETAQGIFLNFRNVLDTMRVKVPFGVAQVGKAFRNEVTPRNYIFRSREFEQMEMEWFCHPDESQKWYEFWKAERMKWWRSLGVSESNLKFRDHEPDELSHYSKMTVDIEYRYPFTAPDFGELEGIAHRGCFDLTQHQQHSGEKMEYFDQQRNERYIPNVIEPASGLTRAVLVLLCEAFTPDESRPSKLFMKFDPKFAPIKVGVFPLVAKDGMPEVSEKLYLDLRNTWTCEHDVKQSIGKRYARMDEIGTPFCITVDGQTLQDQTVTIRGRDSMTQERIGLDKVRTYLLERL